MQPHERQRKIEIKSKTCCKCALPRATGQSYCKEHRREYERNWKKTPIGRRKNHEDAVKRLYGITLIEYQAIIANPCEICGQLKPPVRMGKVMRSQMHLDHCHSTGKIRGVLCNTCNISLGGFYDSIELLQNAQKYLEKQMKETK